MDEQRISREEVAQLKALIETRFAGDASLVPPYSTDNLTLRLLKDLLAADDALRQVMDFFELNTAAEYDKRYGQGTQDVDIREVARAAMLPRSEVGNATIQ